MAKKTLSERRLDKFLMDEEYGPLLVRLDSKGQREILDLIDANKGREARKRVVELDRQRRHVRTSRERAKRYRAKDFYTRRRERPADEDRLFWAFYEEMG